MRKLLLLLSLTGVVLGGCPHPSLVYPCTCRELGDGSEVRCSEISNPQDLQAMLDRTVEYPFHYFVLMDSSLPYLNASWLTAKSVAWLTLDNCRFKALFYPTPIDAPLPLMEAVIVTNSVVVQRQVQWKDFRPLVRLWLLKLNGMKEVRELGKGFKENVSPELLTLVLTHTPISTLEGALDGKKKLRFIDFQHSAIKVLKNSDFQDQKQSLSSLNLGYNPIESFPDGLFDGFEKLKWVYLNGVKVKTLQEALFTPLRIRLKEVYVRDIPLICDCRMKWILNGHFNIKFHGTCDSPSRLEGKELRRLAPEDFDACGRASNQARRNDLPFEH